MLQRTRRTICRGAFFALVVCPTLGILGWGASHHLPGRIEEHRRELESLLGVQVELESLSHPRPNVTLYGPMRLVDPDSGRLLVSMRQVEVVRREEMVTLTASQPQIDTAALVRLWELIDAALRRQAIGQPPALRLAANEMTLQGGGEAQTFVQVSARLDSTPQGASAGARLLMAGGAASEPIRLVLARSRAQGHAATRLELHSGATHASGRSASPLVPALDRLGPDARFRGSIWLARGPDGWRGEMTGHLARIDLERLVSEQFPHKLSGRADVTIQKAVLRGGRLEQLTASVAAGPGVAGRSLVEAAVEQLGMAMRPDRQPSDDYFSYTQLALACDMREGRLSLRGAAEGPVAGGVLVDRFGTLLSEPSEQPLSVAALVRTLVPQSEVLVPATREADRLLPYLPGPELVRPEADRRGSNPPRPRLHTPAP
jgi:hypothetical protein